MCPSANFQQNSDGGGGTNWPVVLLIIVIFVLLMYVFLGGKSPFDCNSAAVASIVALFVLVMR